MSLYYDVAKQEIVPVSRNIDGYHCNLCGGKQPVQIKMYDIICATCRIVLLSR